MKLTDKLTITNEDNMALMARYPDNHFELAIVDPPYGIDIENSGTHFKKRESKGWDNDTPTLEYFKELQRVSKNQIIWGGNYFLDKLGNCKCFVIWDKKIAEDMSFAMCEMAWTSFKNGAKIYKNTATQIDRIHPTQKPVKLYEWLLMRYATCKTCKNEGGYYEDVAGDGGSKMWIGCDDCYKKCDYCDGHGNIEFPNRGKWDSSTCRHCEGLGGNNNFKVLDTHLGSGSIAIACHNLGFDLTACELDKEYFDASIKRINQRIDNINLFDLISESEQ